MRTGPLHIAIVGKGNLGTHLFNGLLDAHAPYFIGRDLQLHSPTDVVLVCVPDDQTASVCQSLPQDALVAHTAGALPLQNDARRGVFYPLYSFTKEASLNWGEVPILLEA